MAANYKEVSRRMTEQNTDFSAGGATMNMVADFLNKHGMIPDSLPDTQNATQLPTQNPIEKRGSVSPDNRNHVNDQTVLSEVGRLIRSLDQSLTERKARRVNNSVIIKPTEHEGFHH